ncbi:MULTISPECIES: hypothetical protein [Mycobacterium]|jgi:hypothetical protein|uniref:Uncharacterized protein n=4 Tax=Mycobacterium TaxID=1763 RepID=D5P541_9MYCO|nr:MULTISPECIES: hypothetical protein [Mycobacterium]AGZ54598.1 hypothetical protein MKAN_29305 [Mycobacterium kansasii ATCC 12478]ASX03647.1 hypothetical protein CKJ58_26790 [Mycobacterium intracellulare subsp. chimaera]EFG78782.1 hypothetical protein HMPREF0591_1285 [Mycobacterium parascrofulaceum ATCC BAA-614]MBG0730368.1 hypothetical protein [Mycobacterium avium]MCA2311512.1 hypothetical protein [Mycobacterium intracellulare subsp. chimaera]
MSLLATSPMISDVWVAQRLPDLPPAREFLMSAGFGGAAALLAALVLAAVALFAVGRATKRYQQIRDAERDNATVQQCWQRLVWIVETAGVEPADNQRATVGLGPELALELLRGLLRDAEDLRADTLAEAVTVYLNEFSRLLAHQGSVPSEPSATAPADQRPRGNQPAAEPAQTNGAPPETPSKVAVASDRRRQRR